MTDAGWRRQWPLRWARVLLAIAVGRSARRGKERKKQLRERRLHSEPMCSLLLWEASGPTVATVMKRAASYTTLSQASRTRARGQRRQVLTAGAGAWLVQPRLPACLPARRQAQSEARIGLTPLLLPRFQRDRPAAAAQRRSQLSLHYSAPSRRSSRSSSSVPAINFQVNLGQLCVDLDQSCVDLDQLSVA